MAVLAHVSRRGEFRGDLGAFTATVARNKCRNRILRQRLITYVELAGESPTLVDTAESPLDLLWEQERRDLLQEALDSLGPRCANLLRDFYINDLPMESIRERLGCSTLSGAYYVRSQCLKKAFIHLKNRLADCSPISGHEFAGESPREYDQHE